MHNRMLARGSFAATNTDQRRKVLSFPNYIPSYVSKPLLTLGLQVFAVYRYAFPCDPLIHMRSLVPPI